MTSLINKMETDLQIRNLSLRTAGQYLCCARVVDRHFAEPLDNLGTEDVRAFLLHLREMERAPSTLTVYHAALRFLFDETLGKPEVMELVPRPRSKRPPMGVPLTRAEVTALLASAEGDPRVYTIIATFLATGLRLAELCDLQTGGIDGDGSLIQVRCGKGGKGGKPRAVQLGDRHLRLLRRYWKVLRPPGPWVFPAQRPVMPGRVDPVHRWADHPVGHTPSSGSSTSRRRPPGSGGRSGPMIRGAPTAPGSWRPGSSCA